MASAAAASKHHHQRHVTKYQPRKAKYHRRSEKWRNISNWRSSGVWRNQRLSSSAIWLKKYTAKLHGEGGKGVGGMKGDVKRDGRRQPAASYQIEKRNGKQQLSMEKNKSNK